MAKVLIGNVKGQQGIPGKSAYDIAVSHGFEGTEEEWLDSISEKELNKNILKMQSGLDSTKKRLTNVESAIYGDLAREVVDDSVAHVKDVPAAAKPYARVDMIGGMTRKCTNLLPYPYAHTTFTENGITYTDNGNGSITIRGTATDNVTFYLITETISKRIPIKAGQYTASVSPASDVDLIIGVTNIGEFTGSFSVPEDTSFYARLRVEKGTTINATIHPMLNSGSTALPYEPYFEGLRSAKVESVESVGVNIFGGDALADKLVAAASATKDEAAGTVKYEASKILGKEIVAGFKPNTQYTIILYGKNTNAEQVATNFRIVYEDDTSIDLSFATAGADSYCVYTTTSYKNVKVIKGLYAYNETTLYYDKCGIFEGALTVEDFKPYVKHTLPIPAEVREKDGYGDGINKDVNNHIRFEDDGGRTWNKRVGKRVINGTENWEREPNSSFANGTFWLRVWFGAVDTGSNKMSSHYTQRDTSWVNLKNGEFDIIKDRIGLVDERFSTAEEFKAHLAAQYAAGTPVTFVYELATPTTEDISDILPADNMLPVQAGGTATAVNEHNDAVPWEITFVVKEEVTE